jgi:hypothetical protein
MKYADPIIGRWGAKCGRETSHPWPPKPNLSSYVTRSTVFFQSARAKIEDI